MANEPLTTVIHIPAFHGYTYQPDEGFTLTIVNYQDRSFSIIRKCGGSVLDEVHSDGSELEHRDMLLKLFEWLTILT